MSSLSKFEMIETSTLHLKDAEDELMYADGADGKPDLTKPMRVTLYGPGTKQHSKANLARTKKMAKHVNSKGELKLTDDEARTYQAEFVRDVTKSFENIDSATDKTGEDLFFEVYMNLKLKFIVDQCEAHSKETANFSPGSTKN